MGAPKLTAEQYRPSPGLEQFFTVMGDRVSLNILDLGELTQSNVNHITGLGHRLYMEDLLQSAELHFGKLDEVDGKISPEKVNRFLSDSLQFGAYHVDGILAWDVLERLPSAVMPAVVQRLRLLLRPHGVLFACFHSETRGDTVDAYHFRIADSKTLMVTPKGPFRAGQAFNNRSIERLFDQFQSVKFFLGRDYLREVIVRK